LIIQMIYTPLFLAWLISFVKRGEKIIILGSSFS